MIEVVHIINDYNKSSGGAETLVQHIHNGMDDSNIRSTLVGITKSTDVVPNAHSLNVPKLYSFRAFRKLWLYVKGVDDNNIIHAHLFPTILYCSILKRFGILKGPLLFTEHSTSNRRREKFWGRFLDLFIYKQIDYIIAISEGTRNELNKWLANLNTKIQVIPNGIPLKNGEFIRRDKDKNIEIVSIGRLTEAKNYSTMIQAVSMIPEENINYTIVGAGECRDELQEMITALGMDSKINLVGYQKDVSPYLLAADIFFMASKWEGFGLAAVEAMNASLPLVLSDIPGLRELINEQGPAGILVEPNSATQMAKALVKFIQSKELRINYGKFAYAASKRFSFEKNCLAHQDLYNQIRLKFENS